MLGTAGYMVVDHVIIVSAPVQKIGFWGFSDMVRTLGSGCGACWDRGLGLGLGLDKKTLNQKVKSKSFASFITALP